ncbi:calcium-dependent phosphotriesterase [Lojkania enalia]|uniref:Calcium-dependent phosphotriesterase n=1 Tax=Lojkania enalia TaxID=147567 RepID=A0A9P4NDG1_9PLEO|nr:calcium-dependent phosphotriesterase [Didymosphaeria enalia]
MAIAYYLYRTVANINGCAEIELSKVRVPPLLLAIAAPYLYDRWLALSVLWANRPAVFKPIYNIKQHEIKFHDRIRNCEDVVLDEATGLAILSCDPGRDRWNTVMGTFRPDKGMTNGALYIYDYGNPDLSDDEALKLLTLENFNTDDFHPLGIEYEVSTSTLYVVNHAQSGSVIEGFKLSPTSHTATHIKTVKHPLISAPNSIHALGNNKIFFTNDHYLQARMSPLLSKIETFAGIPIGSVVYIDLDAPDTAKTVARLPFANGITMLNSTTLAVASSSKTGVYFYEVMPSYDLKSKGFVRTPSGVDNISVDSNGTLLMAGHPFAPSLMKVSEGRVNCFPDSELEEERKACECSAPSWAAEWSHDKGLKELYKDYGFCSSSMAVRDIGRGLGMVSGLYDRGLMIFKE